MKPQVLANPHYKHGRSIHTVSIPASQKRVPRSQLNAVCLPYPAVGSVLSALHYPEPFLPEDQWVMTVLAPDTGTMFLNSLCLLHSLERCHCKVL